MSRNYGWGSRNALDAVRMELYRQAQKKNMSFLTANTLSDRFSRFYRFMKFKSVNKLEGVNKSLVIEYGVDLAREVYAEKLKPAYAQNLVSAVNSVMIIARGSTWLSVSPTLDCGIPKRSQTRVRPTLTVEECEKAVNYLHNKGHHRAATVAELAYIFGLRSKEASLLNAKAIKKKLFYSSESSFVLEKGTKGGRRRKITVELIGMDVLDRAMKVQANGLSIMPKGETWKSWREHGLRGGRDALHDLGIKGFHEFRSAYATRRYAEIVIDWEAPCNSGLIYDKNEDKKARSIIAKELGHNRSDVVASYIGGRK